MRHFQKSENYKALCRMNKKALQALRRAHANDPGNKKAKPAEEPIIKTLLLKTKKTVLVAKKIIKSKAKKASGKK